MDNKKQRTLLAASVAGLMASVGFASFGSLVHAAEDQNVHCYGINTCKGVGDCGGKGHACAGKNSCQGQGFLSLKQDTCLKIQGGRLTVEPKQKPS